MEDRFPISIACLGPHLAGVRQRILDKQSSSDSNILSHDSAHFNRLGRVQPRLAKSRRATLIRTSVVPKTLEF